MDNRTHLWLAVLVVFATTEPIITAPKALLRQEEAPVKKNDNQLNWLEVADSSPIFTQLMFDFAKPITVTTSYSPQTRQLTIRFPHLDQAALRPQETYAKLCALKRSNLVQEINLREDSPGGSVLTLTFSREIKSEEGAGRPNERLIKWSTLANPNRLLIDIFCKHSLQRLSARNHVLLQATSGAIMSDSWPTIPKPSRKRPQETRIMIDAGHGGEDGGTKSACGVYEKDIALAVSRQVYKQLKSSGYNVHLTRARDTAVSLLKRSELAHQLQADLFVSIHLNSSGSARPSATGVETYFLDDEGLLPPSHQGGYHFVNTAQDRKLVAAATKVLNRNVGLSRSLATNIQSSIVGELRDKGYEPRDRGVKASKVRLLLRNSCLPSTLVEVGFLDNPQEAERLKDPEYQGYLAQGICRGITQHLKAGL